MPSRKDWEDHLADLRGRVEDSAISDDEKVRVLHEALSQRIEDSRVQEEHKVASVRRLVDEVKERDRIKSEVQKAHALRFKLEDLCREQQTQALSIGKENVQIAEEEKMRHTALKDKFEEAIKDVQEKMAGEFQVRDHFLKENEELAGKLKKFTETFEQQEADVSKRRESRKEEMETAMKRLKEREVATAEAKANATSLERQNEALRRSQTILQDELHSILIKFDEFHKAVTSSGQLHSEVKVEVDALQRQVEELERENVELRNGVELQEVVQEQQVAQRQRDAMEKLCDNLEKEIKKLREELGGK